MRYLGFIYAANLYATARNTGDCGVVYSAGGFSWLLPRIRPGAIPTPESESKDDSDSDSGVRIGVGIICS